ncbi:MAG: Hint domain-containing protein [Pseudomonadota bacterium]
MVAPSDAAFLTAPLRPSPIRPNAEKTPNAGRKPLSMRKYSIRSLGVNGGVKRSDQIGPAMPIFESAFSAFAHGSIISTEAGPVAVEDLEPGMKIVTLNDTAEPLLWLGAMTLVPRSDNTPMEDNRTASSLTRVMADSFGVGRPHADLMAGPGARLMLRRPARFSVSGDDRPLTPAANIADGMNATQIVPPTPVALYHLCLPKHAIISANGIDAESFHPGAGFERNMGPNMLTLFLSFFPHVKEARDFGPLAHPRLPFGTFDSSAELA